MARGFGLGADFDGETMRVNWTTQSDDNGLSALPTRSRKKREAALILARLDEWWERAGRRGRSCDPEEYFRIRKYAYDNALKEQASHHDHQWAKSRVRMHPNKFDGVE